MKQAVPRRYPEGLAPRFWERKSLAEMDRDEWEALCDGCGKCCLHKLEDVDTGLLHWTNVACRLLDLGSCACSDYPGRHRYVPDCVELDPVSLADIDWLPASCAYRRLSEGRPLADWHPLISGTFATVGAGGHSIAGWSISEQQAGDHWDHLVDAHLIHGD